MSGELLNGVCCQYCQHFETSECPVQTASPWSRWGNWCSEYQPTPNEPDARSLVAAFAERKLVQDAQLDAFRAEMVRDEEPPA